MKKAVDLLVKVTRRQAVNFTGKTLRSVQVDDYLLVVHRKMYRGRFAICYYPLNEVIAYQEGNGGKDGSAYAIVIDDVVIKTIQGKGIIDELGTIKIVDDDGQVHYINTAADEQMSVSIVELEPGEIEPLQLKDRRRPIETESTEAKDELDILPVRGRGRPRKVEVESSRGVGRPKGTGKEHRSDDWDEVTPRRGRSEEF